MRAAALPAAGLAAGLAAAGWVPAPEDLTMVLTEDRNREKVAETLLCTSANIFGSNWAMRFTQFGHQVPRKNSSNIGRGSSWSACES